MQCNLRLEWTNWIQTSTRIRTADLPAGDLSVRRDTMKNDASYHTTGLVWGAILPHGPDIVLEVTREPALMAETRAAMEVAGHRFAAARVDTVILLDPLLVHTQNSFEERSLFQDKGVLSIGMAGHAGGTMGHVRERFACDESLARTILEAGRAASLPVAGDAGRNGELVLAGALNAVPMRVDFLSYAVPSYYGMVVATYELER